MISQLDFYVEEVLNPKVMIIKDASYYNPEITPTGGLLVIQYPGSDVYISFSIGINFTYKINSNTLGITNVVQQSQLSDLPDGLYTIRYSICPNDELFVEYKFLRNVKQLIRYNNLYCSLQVEKCDHKSYKEAIEKLREIKSYIDAAVYKANCCQYDKAIELYDYACSLMDKFEALCECYG